MAAATENLDIVKRGIHDARRTDKIDVAASTEIFRGTMVCLDGSGNAVPAGDTAGYTKVIGVAEDHVDNSSGSAGDEQIQLLFNAEFKLNHTGLTADDNLTGGVVSDDNTITDAATATNDIHAGEIRKIDGSEVWIFIGYGTQ